MKKFIIIPIFLLVANFVYSQKSYRCFDCDNNEKLKISVEYLDDTPVFIKYKGQNSSIFLTLIKENKKSNKGYSATEESYNEIINGQYSGKYIFTHSGNWDYIVYKRKDGRQFKFTVNIDESLDPKGDGYRTTPCY